MRISDWSSDVCSSDLQFAQFHAESAVEIAQPLERAMDKDRRVMSRRAQFGDHPLRLAKRIGADKDAPVGLGGKRRHQPFDFRPGFRMAEEGQGKGSSRSEEHTSELPSQMRTSYDVLCLTNNNTNNL